MAAFRAEIEFLLQFLSESGPEQARDFIEDLLSDSVDLTETDWRQIKEGLARFAPNELAGWRDSERPGIYIYGKRI